MHMNITPYVEGLRRDLTAAAEAGGEEARASAERLALALDPAVRLALFDALSQAAAEITQDMSGGSVEVRIKGRDPQFVVDLPAANEPAEIAPDDSTGEEDEDEEGPAARITLRLPESLKQRAEDAANRRGQSLNTWLVSAVRLATRDRSINVDIDLSSLPFGMGPGGPGRGGRSKAGPGKRISGWAR
jgi:hypothetical protein